MKAKKETALAKQLTDLTLQFSQDYARQLNQNNVEWQNLLTSTIEESDLDIKEQKEVMGAEIDRLTRKHDYLYESCTTVQSVNGELVIN